MAAGLGLAACGSSSSSTSSSSSSAAAGSSASSSSSVSISVGGGSFCSQLASAVAQFEGLAKSLAPSSPGGAPDINGLKQLIGAEVSLLDSLDGSAPSEIAADFHTLRVALDQANGQVQSATTLQQLETSLSSVGTPAVTQADKNITTYGEKSCGISTSTTST